MKVKIVMDDIVGPDDNATQTSFFQIVYTLHCKRSLQRKAVAMMTQRKKFSAKMTFFCNVMTVSAYFRHKCLQRGALYGFVIAES